MLLLKKLFKHWIPYKVHRKSFGILTVLLLVMLSSCLTGLSARDTHRELSKDFLGKPIEEFLNVYGKPNKTENTTYARLGMVVMVWGNTNIYPSYHNNFIKRADSSYEGTSASVASVKIINCMVYVSVSKNHIIQNIDVEKIHNTGAEKGCIFISSDELNNQ